MELIPVNIEMDDTLDLCMQFRRDAHAVSFGNDAGFNVDETKAWFTKL
ncbi:GNAT family N-acetyltransferase, partial [Vibrio parahaemolyticus]